MRVWRSLVRTVLRASPTLALRVFPRLFQAAAITLGVVALLSLPLALLVLAPLVRGAPEAERCSTSRGVARAPDHAAADRLRSTLAGFPGVTATTVEFDQALWPALVDRVKVRVGFAADAGPDQVRAVVAPAVDGLRAPEFRGLDTHLAFAVDPAAEYQVFGLPSTEDVLADAAVWLDLHSRHPGTAVQLCPDPDGDNTRSVEVPVVWDEDPAPVTAAFAELRSLPVDLFHWSTASVRAIPGPTGHPGRATFTVVKDIPEDETITGMIAAVRRPPSLSPADELAATVTSYPSIGDWAPRTEVTVEFGIEELRPAPASEVLAPGSRAQQVAAAFAAQVAEATGRFHELEVSLWDTRILDE